ncbi:MAG: hypothetical protein AB7F40_08000 [Victivallaceae bacterium]|nr:hypothetical protein [Victivallaceae bacterium]
MEYDFPLSPPIEKRETINVELQELFSVAKVDYTRLYIADDLCGCQDYLSRYELRAEDYLQFAKCDFRSGADARARINAVTNAKRAIDCQIDNILFSLRYNFKKEPQKIVERMMAMYCDGESKKTLKSALKLALIASIDLSPMVLISDARKLRHSVEHTYVVPKQRDVETAIEVAELFIGTTHDRRLDAINFRISDTKLEATNKYDRILGIEYNNDDDCSEPASLRYIELSGNDMKEWVCELNPDSMEYWLCVRMSFLKKSDGDFLNTFIELLKLAKKDIPYDRIKIKENNC